MTRRSPLTGPRDPLFDDLAPEISVDLAILGASNSIKQVRVGDSLLQSVAVKPLRFLRPALISV